MFDAIRTWYEVGWGNGDEDVLARQAHPDIEDLWHEVSGIDALTAVVRDLRRTFPDLHIEVVDQVADDRRITTVWRMTGTDTGGLFSLPPSGRSVDIQAICLDDLFAGRVRRHQQVSDMWRLARQLQVIPDEWQADRQLR